MRLQKVEATKCCTSLLEVEMKNGKKVFGFNVEVKVTVNQRSLLGGFLGNLLGGLLDWLLGLDDLLGGLLHDFLGSLLGGSFLSDFLGCSSGYREDRLDIITIKSWVRLGFKLSPVRVE